MSCHRRTLESPCSKPSRPCWMPPGPAGCQTFSGIWTEAQSKPWIEWMARQAVAGWHIVIDFRVSLSQAKQEMYQPSAARRLKPRKPADAEKPPARPEAFLVRRSSSRGYYSKTGLPPGSNSHWSHGRCHLLQKAAAFAGSSRVVSCFHCVLLLQLQFRMNRCLASTPMAEEMLNPAANLKN